MSPAKNIPQSVLARLKNKAKEANFEYQQVLTRYGLERMLYRLSISEHAGAFLLKGAMLFNLWFDIPVRPTTDVDMLGYGDHGLDALQTIFRDICIIEADDGIVFDPDTVEAAEIRKESNYAGVRVTFTGLIDKVRCPIQVDIGYGDAVTPGAEDVAYPVLLDDMPSPALRAYPRYTVVAEKTEALISLAMANTRMKDYFDLWILSRHSDFEGEVMQRALLATLERRKTPAELQPIGLSDEFAEDAAKLAQWRGFIKKNRLEAPELPAVIEEIRAFLLPVLAGNVNDQCWTAGGQWK